MGTEGVGPSSRVAAAPPAVERFFPATPNLPSLPCLGHLAWVLSKLISNSSTPLSPAALTSFLFYVPRNVPRYFQRETFTVSLIGSSWAASLCYQNPSSSLMGEEGTKEEGKEGGSAYPFAKVKWSVCLRKRTVMPLLRLWR
uniref:Uncharacterized protein n=1 Tax=Rousettus aegyptiacus TaxID=9407 RepID=A0A7J8BF70_ROUAE|nr:hypothetical protein HJG63_009813 [Rousettus aegyptiacus]